MPKPPSLDICPRCGQPLDLRAAQAAHGTSDENLWCLRCGWERDAGAEPEEIDIVPAGEP